MKFLVTGGSGLIGSAMAKYLVRKGEEVNIIDLHDIKIKGVKFFRGSILDKNALSNAMKGCDYVFHFAAVLGVEFSNKMPLECLDVNITGTRNVLESCLKENVKKIVFSSSSEVYGEPVKLPIREDATLQPKSEYGVSKVVGEEYCKAFKKEYGLDYTIIRFCNVYGPNQALKFVMPIFIDNAILGKPIKVHGSGEQIRSFCYVDDAIIGTEAAMLNKKADNNVFNIGNDKEATSILAAAKKVLSLMGKNQEPMLIPMEQSDRTVDREIYKRIPDISKAKKILGFEPKISLEGGIRRVIEYRKKFSKSVPIEPTNPIEDN